MARFAQWVRDASVAVPSNYIEWELKWGAAIRANEVDRRELKRSLGIGMHSIENLIALAKGRTVHPIPSLADGEPPPPGEPSQSDSDEPTEEADGASRHELLHGEKWVYDKATDRYITFCKAAPKPITLPAWKHKAIVKAYSNWDGQPASLNEICRQFTFPRAWLIEYLRAHNVTHDREPFTQKEVLERDPTELVEELLESRRQNLHEKWDRRRWDAIKKQAAKFEQLQNGSLEPISEHFKDIAPKYRAPRITILSRSERRFALVVHATDFHWGMYASPAFSRDPYDRTEARRRLIAHTEELISMLPGQPERIYCGFGGDWMHVDTRTGTTTRGTPQDTDGLWSEIFNTGVDMAREHLEMLRQVAPVLAVPVPGNHGNISELAMAKALEGWFHTYGDVEVISSLIGNSRVYTEYGGTLMCWNHGDKANEKKYATMMPNDVPQAWARCPHRIAIQGHWHHKKVLDVDGVDVYQFPSLAGLDAWHLENGYVTSKPGLAGIVVSHDKGPIQMLMSEAVRKAWRTHGG